MGAKEYKGNSWLRWEHINFKSQSRQPEYAKDLLFSLPKRSSYISPVFLEHTKAKHTVTFKEKNMENFMCFNITGKAKDATYSTEKCCFLEI